MNLTKNNSTDLGFANSAFFIGAISWEEFKQWLFGLIETYPVADLPTYIFDVAAISEPADYGPRIEEIYGFWPALISEDEDDARRALHGIAFVRDVQHCTPFVTRQKAFEALERHPEIADRFRLLFPFIRLTLPVERAG